MWSLASRQLLFLFHQIVISRQLLFLFHHLHNLILSIKFFPVNEFNSKQVRTVDLHYLKQYWKLKPLQIYYIAKYNFRGNQPHYKFSWFNEFQHTRRWQENYTSSTFTNRWIYELSYKLLVFYASNKPLSLPGIGGQERQCPSTIA